MHRSRKIKARLRMAHAMFLQQALWSLEVSLWDPNAKGMWRAAIPILSLCSSPFILLIVARGRQLFAYSWRINVKTIKDKRNPCSDINVSETLSFVPTFPLILPWFLEGKYQPTSTNSLSWHFLKRMAYQALSEALGGCVTTVYLSQS